jgi:hypothetical protein
MSISPYRKRKIINANKRKIKGRREKGIMSSYQHSPVTVSEDLDYHLHRYTLILNVISKL